MLIRTWLMPGAAAERELKLTERDMAAPRVPAAKTILSPVTVKTLSSCHDRVLFLHRWQLVTTGLHFNNSGHTGYVCVYIYICCLNINLYSFKKNKAKKSANDLYELLTESLCKTSIEQSGFRKCKVQVRSIIT